MRIESNITKNTSAEEIFKRFPPLNYEVDYTKSIENPNFFNKFVNLIDWFSLSNLATTDIHDKEKEAEEHKGFIFKEFFTGQLNACYNCLDRHPEDTDLLLFESNLGNLITFNKKLLMERVQQYSHELLKYLRKYDITEKDRSTFVVTIFMPMCPDTICIILACARLGLPHSVVFAGYSSNSLIKRIKDAKSRLLISTDFYKRGEKTIDFKNIFEELKAEISKEKLSLLIVSEKMRQKFEKQGRGINAHVEEEYEEVYGEINEAEYFKPEKVLKENYIPCFPVEANHPLFYLYTSGSTGDPKGIVHTTANYLIYAMITLKHNFYNENIQAYNRFYKSTLKNKDINYKRPFYCTADVGWITGHTYSLYGPLCLGLTTLISTGIPNYPPNKIYTTLKVSKAEVFYTAPTLIRSLKEAYDVENCKTPKDLKEINETISIEEDHNPNEVYNKPLIKNLEKTLYLPDLRLIGSVGEPLNNDAKTWVCEYFKTNVIDTYWQTETGGHLLSGVEGCKPMYGVVPQILLSISDYEDHLLGTEGISEYSIQSADPLNISQGSLSEKTKGVVIKGNTEITETTLTGSVCFKKAWPGISKTIIGDHSKYLNTYFELHPGYYFTGDQGYVVHDFLNTEPYMGLKVDKASKKQVNNLDAIKDCVCYQTVLQALKNKSKRVKIHSCSHYSYVITGRTDDVLNVSGHRISTKEVEDAVTSLEYISECAVVSALDKLTGESIVLFIALNIFKVETEEEKDGLKKIINNKLRKAIGSHIKPSSIYLISKLPTTRTGKIMRRTLKAIVRGEELGDISTCINKEVLEEAKLTVKNSKSL